MKKNETKMTISKGQGQYFLQSHENYIQVKMSWTKVQGCPGLPQGSPQTKCKGSWLLPFQCNTPHSPLSPQPRPCNRAWPRPFLPPSCFQPPDCCLGPALTPDSVYLPLCCFHTQAAVRHSLPWTPSSGWKC